MASHNASPNNLTTTLLGKNAEEIAKEFLQTKQLKWIEDNYHCEAGEIDLIMQDGDYRVFIEVRLRKEGDYGSSIETIDRGKQNRIIRTAKHYLQKHQLTDKVDCRFDVVGIDGGKITWIPDAFSA